MLKNYLLGLGIGAALLAGCGQSRQTTETAAPPAAASTAAPSAAAQPQPAAPPQPEVQPLTLTLPQSDVELAPEPAAPATAPAWAGRSGRHRTAGPRPLAPGPAVATSARRWVARPATAVTAPAPADTAAAAELRAFLRSGLPAAQTFALRPDRDTLLLGAQGTQLLLPANAFDLSDSTATVRLHLQEFYTPADMVLAGLSTASGPNLLETGGMVYLTATANGQPVQLRPGRRVALRLPTPKAQPDMQLFEGVAHGTTRPLDWQLPDARLAARSPGKLAKPHLRVRWPENVQFERTMRARLLAAVPSQLRVHRSAFSSPRTRRVLAALSEHYPHAIVRLLDLRFAVDSLGGLGKVEVMPGSDELFASAAVAALRQAAQANWLPARLPTFAGARPVDEFTPAVGKIRILFTKKHGFFIQSVSWSLPRPKQPRARWLRHRNDSLVALPAFRLRYWRVQDSLAYLRLMAMQGRLQAEQARLRAQFTDTTRTAITQDGVYNELQTQGLGWINCDRFSRGNTLFTYQVKAQRPEAIISLVFKDIRGVLRGELQDGNLVAFDNAPFGRDATVIALSRRNGVTYLARHDVRLGTVPLASLDFHPVTMAELRTELATLR